MSEPNDLDNAFAIALAEMVCDDITSRSLYEDEKDRVRRDGGRLVQVFREHREKAERERVLTAIEAWADSQDARYRQMCADMGISSETTLGRLIAKLRGTP